MVDNLTLARPLDWRPFAWTALWTVNFILLAVTLAAFVYADVGVDWAIFTEAGRRFTEGGLYTWDGLPYRYSPLAAPLFAALAPIGYVGWTALHFAALLGLPRKIVLLALLSAPFWNDVYNGNTMTFVFVAAWWALRGTMGSESPRLRRSSVSRAPERPEVAGAEPAVGVNGRLLYALPFLALFLLIPRPIMLPVLGYVLWTRREWVVPFAVMAAVSLVGAWATGWLDEWAVSEVVNLTRSDIKADFGPALLIGAWWYPVGLGLAAWAAMRGRLGAASFLAAGYWSVHYALMLLLELRGRAASPDR